MVEKTQGNYEESLAKYQIDPGREVPATDAEPLEICYSNFVNDHDHHNLSQQPPTIGSHGRGPN